jgi:hypothetical protein
MTGYIVFAVGALLAAAIVGLWVYRRLAARRSRGGRRW